MSIGGFLRTLLKYNMVRAGIITFLNRPPRAIASEDFSEFQIDFNEMKIFKEIAHCFHDDVEILNKVALLLQIRHFFTMAKQVWERVLELEPGNVTAQMHLTGDWGSAYKEQEMGDWTKKITHTNVQS